MTSSVKPDDVTLYIPAQNAAATLSAAIDSVRAQTVRPSAFLIVLDTRSSDATTEIAHRSGVPIIAQTEGRLGHGRNLAIRACRTTWLASCDADVALEPTWLEALLSAAGEGGITSVGGTRGNSRGGGVAAIGGCTHERLLTAGDRWRAVNMPHNWGPLSFDNPFMLVSEMMARVDALRCVGGYRADFSDGDDSDLCRRLRDAGYALRYEPAAVAHHHRGDSVAGVLDLRWRYSFPRQRGRLENLPGLISKLPINRVYCLQSLSQMLHSDHVDCCAISLLLWFHHGRRDLQAVLGHWSLLSDADRSICLAALDQALAECLGGAWREILPPMRRLLPAPYDAAATPGHHGLAATAGFQRYLAATRDATRELLGEIPQGLRGTLLQSAERLAGGARSDSSVCERAAAGHTISDVPPFRLPRLEVQSGDHERLGAVQLRPAWDWAELHETLQSSAGVAVDQAEVLEQGPRLPVERPPGELRGQHGHTPRLALLPHLETALTPREALRELLTTSDVAVVAYQPPRVFIPAVPILSARDLASECAAIGFQIRHFHTEAGLTRLIVERGTARAPRPLAESVQRVECGLDSCSAVPES